MNKFGLIASKVALDLVRRVYAVDTRYQEEDGSFKVQKPRGEDDAKETKFGGCVNFMMSKGYSKESASNICGWIKSRKGGFVQADPNVNKARLLNIKEGEIIPMTTGQSYTVVKVNDKNIAMNEQFKKQLMDEGLYDRCFISILSSGGKTPPYSMDHLPIYGDPNKYVTKWFKNSVKDAVMVDLRDRRMKLTERVASEDKWLTAEEVRAICPSCADRMASCGITKVKSSIIRQRFAYSYDPKDEMRINDIITKSNGSNSAARSLAERMANSITDVTKAVRRYAAAEKILGSDHPVTRIFKERAIELGHPELSEQRKVEDNAREEARQKNLNDKFDAIKPLAEKAARDIKNIQEIPYILRDDFAKYSRHNPESPYRDFSGYWFQFHYAGMMDSDPNEYGGGGYYYRTTPAQKKQANTVIRKLNTISRRYGYGDMSRGRDGNGDYYYFCIPFQKPQ